MKMVDSLLGELRLASAHETPIPMPFLFTGLFSERGTRRRRRKVQHKIAEAAWGECLPCILYMLAANRFQSVSCWLPVGVRELVSCEREKECREGKN